MKKEECEMKMDLPGFQFYPILKRKYELESEDLK